MAEIIRMPRMSDTMTEAVIVAWHKKIGDKVKTGDVLAEVETDKATMEMESFQSGTLLYIGVEAGKSIVVNGVMAIVGKDGDDYKVLLANEQTPATPEAVTQVNDATTSPIEVTASPTSSTSNQPASEASQSSSDNQRIKASPLAKKIADDKGINLSNVNGTGENGRVVKRDLDNIKEGQISETKQAAVASAFVASGVESHHIVANSQMRKTIARRLSESKNAAPHFYLTMSINMGKSMELRKQLNEVSPTKISFNDMVMKAAALALTQHPNANASWLGDSIRYNQHVHIGMAVAIEDGLIVPVVRFANQKTLSQLATETKLLASKAKNKQLQPADWEGNTFTISNLGMFDIDEFTAIINPPDACILAVGSIKEQAISVDGIIQSGHIMKLTLSCDHRVIDGAAGAAFLQTLQQLLENPVTMFL